MKMLKKILIGIGILVAVLLIVSQFLPATYHVERSVVISAKPDAVYPWINNLKKWSEWSPWTAAKDPTIVYSYEGPEEGVGAVSRWDSKKWGHGEMKITEADPAKGLTFDLGFGKGHACKAAFTFAAADSGTKVTWAMDGDVSRNPAERYFSLLLMDSMVGKDFEEGLQNLKRKTEGK